MAGTTVDEVEHDPAEKAEHDPADEAERDPADETEHGPAVAAWLDGGDEPDRPTVAAAVRASLRALAVTAPGRSVEVRVPPFAAVQCIAGPRHTRGNPSNVVQTDPRTWLQLATGRRDFGAAVTDGAVSASGTRAAEVARYLPLGEPIPGRGRPAI